MRIDISFVICNLVLLYDIFCNLYALYDSKSSHCYYKYCYYCGCLPRYVYKLIMSFSFVLFAIVLLKFSCKSTKL